MKADIHPDYNLITVKCSCGSTFETRTTADSLTVELCSQCHPFYTGKQKLVDTGGRIDRFERRYGRRGKGKGDDETPETPETPADEVSEVPAAETSETSETSEAPPVEAPAADAETSTED